MTEMPNVTVYLTGEQMDWLKKLAKIEDRPVSSMVRKLVSEAKEQYDECYKNTLESRHPEVITDVSQVDWSGDDE